LFGTSTVFNVDLINFINDAKQGLTETRELRSNNIRWSGLERCSTRSGASVLVVNNVAGSSGRCVVDIVDEGDRSSFMINSHAKFTFLTTTDNEFFNFNWRGFKWSREG